MVFFEITLMQSKNLRVLSPEISALNGWFKESALE